MKTTSAAATILAAGSAVSASPIISARAQMCNAAPTFSGAAPSPLASPSAATALLCRAQCEANNSCQSFVFGLPAGAAAPTCRLFGVPAAQVPNVGASLNIFDRACDQAAVPNVAPTRAQPQGTVGRANGGNNNNNNNNNNAGGNANGNAGDANNNNNNNGGAQNRQPRKRNVCGAAPTGPATSAPSPFQTLTDTRDQAACLARCKATSGCQAAEFGKPTAGGQTQCLLFKVPASQLPPPANGASFVVFDQGC